MTALYMSALFTCLLPPPPLMMLRRATAMALIIRGRKVTADEPLSQLSRNEQTDKRICVCGCVCGCVCLCDVKRRRERLCV